MPARPQQLGSVTPAGEIPVSGGSLMGKIANMPMETMQAPGAMFGGKGTAGSPTAPTPGAPQQIQMPGAGGGQAQPIFGGQTGGQGQPGNGPDIWSMLQQLLQTQQPLQPGGM